MQYNLYNLQSLQFQPFHCSAKLYTTYLDQHSLITEANILKGHHFLRFPLTASRSPSSPSNSTLSHSYCIPWILSPLHPKLLDFCPTEPRLWSLNSNIVCVSRLLFGLHTAGLLEIPAPSLSYLVLRDSNRASLKSILLSLPSHPTRAAVPQARVDRLVESLNCS
jgi:hypothetical protein